MLVTEVRKAKGTRYHVSLDGEYWQTLSAEIISGFGIKQGLIADESFFDEVKSAADFRRAKERALYLLEYRDHSYGELYEKLCKNVDCDTAEQVCGEMVRLGFINDEAYGERLLESLLNVRQYGIHRARQELLRKKLDRTLVERLIEAYEDDPLERLKEIISKKYALKLSDQKDRQKTINALVRRGYGYDDIKTVIREYIESENEAEY